MARDSHGLNGIVPLLSFRALLPKGPAAVRDEQRAGQPTRAAPARTRPRTVGAASA